MWTKNNFSLGKRRNSKFDEHIFIPSQESWMKLLQRSEGNISHSTQPTHIYSIRMNFWIDLSMSVRPLHNIFDRNILVAIQLKFGKNYWKFSHVDCYWKWIKSVKRRTHSAKKQAKPACLFSGNKENRVHCSLFTTALMKTYIDNNFHIYSMGDPHWHLCRNGKNRPRLLNLIGYRNWVFILVSRLIVLFFFFFESKCDWCKKFDQSRI